MKVSIIIPAYNVESYIEACLRSVKSQTLQDIEVIVVNDGSTDRTCKKIEYLINEDSRIRLINQKNLGPGEARNNALVEAKGEYIFFLDADDTLPIDACEKLYNHARLKKADVIVGKMVWKDKHEYTDVIYNKYWFNNMSIERDYSKCINIVTGLPTVTARLIKRTLITQYQLKFPKFFGEDLAFWLYVWHKATSIYLLDEIVYYRTYRLEEYNRSITQTIDLKVIQDRLEIIKICKNYCDNYNLDKVSEKILYSVRDILLYILKLDLAKDRELALRKLEEVLLTYDGVKLIELKCLLLFKSEIRGLMNSKISNKVIERRIKQRMIFEADLRNIYRKIKKY